MKNRSLFAILGGFAILLTACGTFGLPTGRDGDNIEKGEPTILDVSPKAISVGTTSDYSIFGIDTYFESDSEIRFPDLPEVIIVEQAAPNYERLNLVLEIPEDAPLSASDLEVYTDEDGWLYFENALTLVH